MFPSQMVRLKIVEPSSGLTFSSVSMFPSQMVRLKIVEPSTYLTRKWWSKPSSGPLFPCFPRKWYALKLTNPQTFSMFPSQMVVLKLSNLQVAHFFNVSLANGTP